MKRFLLASAVLATAFSAQAAGEKPIRAVGSSTVYPFVTAAAEAFGQGKKFPTPIVESTGTGGGFKLFCGGVGADMPDISNASRPIAPAERELCAKNGVKDIAEIAIGYDGIVLASSKKAAPLPLTKKEIFLALAREVPVNGKLAPNPNRNWRDINAKLPSRPLTLYGPPPTSGTRDAFVEMVMEKACEQFPEFKTAYPDEKQRKTACKSLREDGVFVEAGEDDNIIIQKLTANPDAVGILGYSFLEENKARVQASTIDGVPADEKHVEDGSYGISRSMYIYVKKQHVGQTPGLAEFAREIVSNGSAGPEGYLVQKGLLPLHADELKKAQKTAAGL